MYETCEISKSARIFITIFGKSFTCCFLLDVLYLLLWVVRMTCHNVRCNRKNVKYLRTVLNFFLLLLLKRCYKLLLSELCYVNHLKKIKKFSNELALESSFQFIINSGSTTALNLSGNSLNFRSVLGLSLIVAVIFSKIFFDVR